jgi:hypothetical protein
VETGGAQGGETLFLPSVKSLRGLFAEDFWDIKVYTNVGK